MHQHRLSFIWNAAAQRLEIAADAPGLDLLIETLEKLKHKPVPEHSHLYTEEWAGDELTQEPMLNPGDATVHHVKIHHLPSE